MAHLKDDHKVDMHNGSTFNHRYVKSNPHEVENATWMLTVLFCFILVSILVFVLSLILSKEGFSYLYVECVWIQLSA